MTDFEADPKKLDRDTQYLTSLLALSPTTETSRIFALRAKYLSGETSLDSPPPPPVPATSQRGATRARYQKLLESVRQSFWEAPASELLASLEKIDTENFPEFRSPVERLRASAHELPTLRELSQKGYMTSKFYSQFRRLVTAPTAEASAVREEIYRSIRYREQLPTYKKMAKRIRKTAPQTAAQEFALLQSILDLKQPNYTVSAAPDVDEYNYHGETTNAPAQPETSGCTKWFLWIFFFMVFRTIIGLFL